MLSLNQAKDLHDFTANAQNGRALQEFIDAQRMFFVRQMVSCLRENNTEEAKKFAAQDEAYAELLANLRDFIEKALRQ
jgi:hypothetical protein